MEMHGDQENNVKIIQRQQPYRHTVQSVARTRTTTKDDTGNGQFDTGEETEKECYLETLPSSAQTVSLLLSKSDSESLLPTPPQESQKVKPCRFADNVNNCGQKKSFSLNEVSVTNAKRCASTKKQVCPTYLNKDQPNSPIAHNLALQSDLSILESVKGKTFGKTGHLCAQSPSHYNKSSNIYGGVEDGPLTIIGSWALQSLSDNMQPRPDAGASNNLRESMENKPFVYNNAGVESSSGKHVNRDQVKDSTGSFTSSGSQWQFQASAGTLLQIRASHLVKLMCMLMLLIAVFSFVFHSRIRALEDEKKALFSELEAVKMHVQLLVNKMDDVVSLVVPTRSQQQQDLARYNTEQRMGESADEETSNGNGKDFDADFNPIPIHETVRTPVKKIVKRSAAASRTTKELLYPSDSMGMNALNNETTVSYGSKMDDWTVSNLERPKPIKGNRNNMKTKSHKTFIRQLLRKELRKLKNAHRLETKKLKQNLKQAQQQISSANLSCCNDTSQNSLSPAQSAFGFENSRAVYLQIDGASVNIKKPRQLIGPWYFPNTGNEIGFNDMWYNHLTLDSNGTSVVFQESGLYLISAQIFYQLQHLHNSKPTPMGYRVHLKKNGSENRRPLTIAECVPSFPSTVYQTCFTQVAWYVEARDEVYLEHFTDSLPIIEALRSGQTFLGLVRLN